MTPKICLPSVPSVNTVLQIDSVASLFGKQSPYQNPPLTVHVNTNANIPACLSLQLYFSPKSPPPLCCLCNATVWGYIKHTYAHPFTDCISLSFLRCLQPINIHLSGISLSLSLSLWCRMTDRAKCQFIFRC